MSSEIAIKVENLSKTYLIYEHPRSRLKQFIIPRIRNFLGLKMVNYYREFWALKNISFEIKKGETVGIIGRNGSGKSTLLQMICGTLNPSEGRIQTKGRIAGILELGSGFNPEFTGRENIFMNAAILGLKSKEIETRFNDIVEFADIGNFLDQPIKTYSSGMLMRLAFSVMVHVDSDILVVDEALAVGDAFFTQKCMTQIKKLIESGVTLLFVSHDTNAVKSLCNRALLLENGNMLCFGNTNEVVEAYYSKFVQNQQEIISPALVGKEAPAKIDLNYDLIDKNDDFKQRALFKRIQNGKAEFVNVQLLDINGNVISQVDFGQIVVLRMLVNVKIDLPLLGLAYHIRDKNGFDLVYSDTGIDNCHISNSSAGILFVINWKFKVTLREGDYTIAAMASIPKDLNIGLVEVCDFVPIAYQFKVHKGYKFPIYGAVYWENKITFSIIGSDGIVVPAEERKI